jgi:hypothetical protein
MSRVEVHDLYWSPRLRMNAEQAIFHQWNQLEASGCIENFRLLAGQASGFREGWFFADSDAYRWLDAASRIYAVSPSADLKAHMDELLSLIASSQAEDGYLYTYNQLLFSTSRWENLLIEHELYCHGHLIEACASCFQATGDPRALEIARRTADLLVETFLKAGDARTSGHEEIEIALLRLHEITGQSTYLALAQAFLERRGRMPRYLFQLLAQNRRVERRKHLVQVRRKAYLELHPEHARFHVPPENFARTRPITILRSNISALTGKYFQMHAPIRMQTVPVGHAVRFGYLETAMAMLTRLTGDQSLLPAMQSAWERMVTHRMYITGGLGALPGLEGFGRDDELDPETAYAETCAALASLFWNSEMARLTREAKYSDLFEWQLYNAAAPGIGLDGSGYLYNNPLLSRGKVTRRAWYEVPCCPSNLSRTWASLGDNIYTQDGEDLWLQQYIGSTFQVGSNLWTLESELPWRGKICLRLDASEQPWQGQLNLRLPSWAGTTTLRVNGEMLLTDRPTEGLDPTASGFDPRAARFLLINRRWSAGDWLDMDFEMPITLRQARTGRRRQRDKVALSRGPLVYCLENIDNPGLDITSIRLRKDSLSAENAPTLLGGTWILKGQTDGGGPLTAIPYQLWANRGESQMTVWIRC